MATELFCISFYHKRPFSAREVVWDVAKNKLLMTLELDEPVFSKDSFYPFPWGLCWSPNGKYVAACFPKSSRVYIWNVQTNGQPDAPGTTRKQMLLALNIQPSKGIQKL